MAITEEQMDAIVNLMDRDISNEANLTCEENDNIDFIRKYLELDPEFAYVLDSEFGIDTDEFE